MVKAVFFDRDGVLVKSIKRPEKIAMTPPWTWEEFQLLPYAQGAPLITRSIGFRNFVITNQPDVNDGFTTLDVVQQINNHVKEYCHIDDVCVCFDRQSADYKPLPGMLYKLQQQYDIDFSRSYTIGDRWRDIVCGHTVGTTNILINDGTSDEWPDKYKHIQPHYVCRNVLEACDIILQHEVEHEY